MAADKKIYHGPIRISDSLVEQGQVVVELFVGLLLLLGGTGAAGHGARRRARQAEDVEIRQKLVFWKVKCLDEVQFR